MYLWILVLGNIVAVLVISFVGNLSDEIGRRLPVIVGAFGAELRAQTPADASLAKGAA